MIIFFLYFVNERCSFFFFFLLHINSNCDKSKRIQKIIRLIFVFLLKRKDEMVFFFFFENLSAKSDKKIFCKIFESEAYDRTYLFIHFFFLFSLHRVIIIRYTILYILLVLRVLRIGICFYPHPRVN